MSQNGGSAIVVEKEGDLMEVDMSVKSMDDDDVDAIIEEDPIEMDDAEDVDKYIEEEEDLDGATMNYDDLVVEDDGESLSNGALPIKEQLAADDEIVNKTDRPPANGIGNDNGPATGEKVPQQSGLIANAPENNGYARSNNKDDDDYDRPVSIPSDSNSEGEEDTDPVPSVSRVTSKHVSDAVTRAATSTTTTNHHNGTCDNDEVHEILSDKEDCVVIEDTTPTKSSIAALQSANRIRKAPLRMRDYDDDIQEIPDEDPIAINSTTTIQPVSKKMKLGSGIGGSPGLNLSSTPSSQFPGLPADLSITAGAATKDNKFVLVDQKALLNATTKKQLGDVTNLLTGATPPGLTISQVSGGATGPTASPGMNIRATITPISGNNNVSSSSSNSNANSQRDAHPLLGANNGVQTAMGNSNAATLVGGLGSILLPALTDDMFVLEAPSFIVPYIYEKPPSENLKRIVDDIKKELDALKVQDGGNEKDVEAKKKTEVNLTKSGDAEGSVEPSEGDDLKSGKKGSRNAKGKNADDSWGESDESTDDDASDSETRTKVLIKEVDTKDIESILLPGKGVNADAAKSATTDNYFESPLGQFFMGIGMNMVQEHVQADLLRLQKRKQQREGGKPNVHLQTAINNLMKNLESSRKDNEPFKYPWKRCDFCNFKSESGLAMANHYEKPHLKGNMYKCNFCPFEARPAHDILFHMEAVHNMKSKLEKPLSYHQCPNCPFEDNGKSKLARHTLACTKKFVPENNLLPAQDWDPPAKIPRVKPRHGLVGTATAYQAMAAQQQRIQQGLLSRINVPPGTAAGGVQGAAGGQMQANMLNQANAAALTANAALSLLNSTNMAGLMNNNVTNNLNMGGGGGGSKNNRKQNLNSMMQGSKGNSMRNTNLGTAGGMSNQSAVRNQQQQLMNALLLQNNFNQLAAAAAAKNLNSNQLLQMASQAMLPNAHNSLTIQQSNQQQQPSTKSSKNQQQPSISITPLPRQGSGTGSGGGKSSSGAGGNTGLGTATAGAAGMPNPKPGQHPSGGKSSFVICEICDGYIKDLDQLRSHMQLIHKVKIHPKMIYNRPPLNCQKCQYRFFTDQGLERHLLGSHGLVTSSMQEAANCGQDSGRCPICGRVYQWKLLNHVSRDHNMTLKPAHLSYKCTVCTATFGMYKQFENHVYSAHSTVAKKSGDKKSSSSSSSGFGGGSSSSKSSGGDSLLKPLKINDEITIIPQPPTKMSKTQTIEIE